MQLSQTLHSLTNIKITVAGPQQWRHPFWNPEWNYDERSFSEKLDDCARAMRSGINFTFTGLVFTNGWSSPQRSEVGIDLNEYAQNKTKQLH